MSSLQRFWIVGIVLVAAALACTAPAGQQLTQNAEVGEVTTGDGSTATPYVVTATPEGVVETAAPVESSGGAGDSGSSGDSGGAGDSGGSGDSGGASEPECNYDSVYVADLTIPDGTEVETGTAFTKTWRVQNNGCQPWPGGTTLIFLSGDAMGGPASVPVPETAPSGTQDISVNLTAPATEGTYQAHWQLRTPDGIQFGNKIFVKINAKAPAPVLNITPMVVVPGLMFALTPDFDLKYAGVKKHCLFGGQQMWVKVKNTGNVKFESRYAKVEMPKGTLFTEGSSNSPFIPSFDCVSAHSSLDADASAWMIVAGTTGKSFAIGKTGKITVKLCAVDDLGGMCKSKSVNFTIE